MSVAELFFPKKSTNVRSESPVDPVGPVAVASAGALPARRPRPLGLGLRALRTGLQLVDAGSPELAARLGERLMFQTRRFPEPAAERQLLDRMERFDLITPRGRVAAWRAGHGPTVLLVHGWNGRGAQLGPLVDPLVERGHQVVLFDAPGHGRSPGSESSLFHFADAIDALMEHLRYGQGEGQAGLQGLVSHSMGGAAATYALHRRLERRRAHRAAGELPPGQPLLDVVRVAMVAPPIDIADFIRGFVRIAGLSEPAHQALKRRVERRFELPTEAVRALPLARQMTAPLLVVHDENDGEVPLACGKALAGAWPDATLRVTSGLGHTRILRAPEVVEALVEHVATRWFAP